MPKSEVVKNLDLIQSGIHNFLKPLGFKKKGRSHNRRTDAGLIHVINLQMGEYPIGEHYIIPGIRESFYGKFTINLGVLIPCVYDIEITQQRANCNFVQEYDCTIRSRLEKLESDQDKWYIISNDYRAIQTKIVTSLDQYGLPFLEQFNSYEDILSYYQSKQDLPFQNVGRASLEAALVAYHLGQRQYAETLLRKAYSFEHKGFRQYVEEIAKRIGLPL